MKSLFFSYSLFSTSTIYDDLFKYIWGVTFIDLDDDDEVEMKKKVEMEDFFLKFLLFDKINFLLFLFLSLSFSLVLKKFFAIVIISSARYIYLLFYYLLYISYNFFLSNFIYIYIHI